MNIGAHAFEPAVILAPMAGITDAPFRRLCRQMGADYAVSEMITSKAALWDSRKTRTRLEFADEPGPRVIQIAGSDPREMAAAAGRAVGAGADAIDINMGCPAKKVCNRLAGSALLADEALVARILDAVCAAVDVPVTLKIRTGSSTQARNGVRIARLAEDAGIRALVVHGRTRACAFRGAAEYDTIAAIKAAVAIPVVANGDITDGALAVRVLAKTAADGIMIGRATQGNPWIFGEIKAALAGRPAPQVGLDERRRIMLEHLEALHEHYGIEQGVRVARKHVGWYLEGGGFASSERAAFNRLIEARAQREFIERLSAHHALDRAA